MSSEEHRLFHRYDSSLRVQFMLDSQPMLGSLVNVSAGGCFVVASQAPAIGQRLKCSLQRGDDDVPVVFDIQVAWVKHDDVPVDQVGFGGFWLYAYSKQSAEHLESVLGNVLGITKVSTRCPPPTSGRAKMHVYRFPVVYDGTEEHSFSEDWSDT